MKDVWERGCTACAWHDAALVPIPKKGDLFNCDNWRGISLLDAVVKVAARILKRGFRNWLRMHYAPDDLGGKVTNRDTNLWTRDRSQCANREVHRCIPEVYCHGRIYILGDLLPFWASVAV